MNRDVKRWQHDGNRKATVERTCDEMLASVKDEEKSRLLRLCDVHEAFRAETNDAPGSKRGQHLAAPTVTMARQDNFGRSVDCGKSWPTAWMPSKAEWNRMALIGALFIIMISVSYPLDGTTPSFSFSVLYRLFKKTDRPNAPSHASVSLDLS